MCLFEKYNVRKYESQLPTVESSCSPCYKGLFISLLKVTIVTVEDEQKFECIRQTI